MKVLHYIPELNEKLGSQYRMMLRMVAAAASKTESYLITSTPLSATSVDKLQRSYGLHVVLLPHLSMRSPLDIYTAYKAMRNTLSTLQPDLVHLHGSWNPLLALMERVAHHEAYVVTISIYGAMAPEILYIDFVKKRMLPLLLYQAPLIRHSSSLLAINEKEWKDISSLGLKKKVEILPAMEPMPPVGPAVQSGVVPEMINYVNPFTSSLLAAYQKTIDSSYRRFLTPEEELFVEKCFIVATLEDQELENHEAELPESSMNIQPSTLNFRRIFFLAYDEDIMPQLLEGASKLGVSIPQPRQIADIPRYKDRKAKRRGAIRDLPLPRRRLRILDDKVDEYQVVVSIIRVQNEGLSRLTYRHKAELYHIFRNLDFDEDLVGRELSRIHLRSFTKKIQKLLGEMYNLPQGYNIF